MLSPGDVRAAVGDRMQPKVDALCQRVDKTLLEKWNEDLYPRVPVYLEKGEYEVARTVQRLYQAKGWKVELHDDQRDGSWLEFSIPPKDREPVV